MPRPVRLDFDGGVYHVVARGNERKPIFLDDGDRGAYLDRLAECQGRFDFRLYGYCLMGNHVHLALERGAVSLSRIVLALHSHYSQRFNRRHDRVGHLFQGRFRSFLVEKEHYLLALLRYIHLNPVRAGLVKRARAYPWSSDRSLRVGDGPPWLDVDGVLSKLASSRSEAVARYRRLVDGPEATEYEDSKTIVPWIRGSEEFARRVISVQETRVRWKGRWTVEEVVDAVARAYGLTVRDLKSRRRRDRCSEARAVAAYLGREEAGIPVSRTALFFRRDESTLVRLALKAESAMTGDRRLSTLVRRIAADLLRPNA